MGKTWTLNKKESNKLLLEEHKMLCFMVPVKTETTMNEDEGITKSWKKYLGKRILLDTLRPADLNEQAMPKGVIIRFSQVDYSVLKKTTWQRSVSYPRKHWMKDVENCTHKITKNESK